MKQTAASPELERLTPFVGIWETKGEVKSGASGQPTRFRATDAYEWLPGGHFLLHRFDADMPDGRVQGIEVIGYDPAKDSYPMHSFDSLGTATSMLARVANGVWTFVGEGLRFTGGFRDDEMVFAGLWEIREDENVNWRPWLELALTRIE